MMDEVKLDYKIREAVTRVLSVAACLATESEFSTEERDAMADNIEDGMLDIIKEIYEDAAYNEWQALTEQAKSNRTASEGYEA